MTRARDEVRTLATGLRAEIEELRIALAHVQLPAVERDALEWLKQLMGTRLLGGAK